MHATPRCTALKTLYFSRRVAARVRGKAASHAPCADAAWLPQAAERQHVSLCCAACVLRNLHVVQFRVGQQHTPRLALRSADGHSSGLTGGREWGGIGLVRRGIAPPHACLERLYYIIQVRSPKQVRVGLIAREDLPELGVELRSLRTHGVSARPKRAYTGTVHRQICRNSAA